MCVIITYTMQVNKCYCTLLKWSYVKIWMFSLEKVLVKIVSTIWPPLQFIKAQGFWWDPRVFSMRGQWVQDSWETCYPKDGTVLIQYRALLIYCHHISLEISWKTLHSSPVRVRYGVSFVNGKFGQSCFIVTIALCVLSCYRWPRYIESLYYYHKALHRCHLAILFIQFW